MTTKTEIRKVPSGQLEELRQISRQTFYETFGATNSQENMDRYLDESFAVERLSEELANPLSQFYFAECEGQIAGYLKVNSGNAQTELQGAGAFEIERIYVSQAYQGKRMGQALFDFALQIARSQNAQFAWLGVWEHNGRAISFYEKNGFTAFDKHIFRVGDDEQTDILMKKPLV